MMMYGATLGEIVIFRFLLFDNNNTENLNFLPIYTENLLPFIISEPNTVAQSFPIFFSIEKNFTPQNLFIH